MCPPSFKQFQMHIYKLYRRPVARVFQACYSLVTRGSICAGGVDSPVREGRSSAVHKTAPHTTAAPWHRHESARMDAAARCNGGLRLVFGKHIPALESRSPPYALLEKSQPPKQNTPTAAKTTYNLTVRAGEHGLPLKTHLDLLPGHFVGL